MTEAVSLIYTDAASQGIVIGLSSDGQGVSLNKATPGGLEPNFVDSVRKFKYELLYDLRKKDAEARVNAWRDFCSQERGYDWSICEWRTRYTHENLIKKMEAYALGGQSLEQLHEAFIRMASLHRITRLTFLNRQAVESPVPQRGYFDEDALNQFARFGMSIEDAAQLYFGGTS